MRRELFLRAYELTHHFHDAQDLLGDVYVKLIEKPPQPRSPSQLKHWLRTVMRNKHIDAQRRRAQELLPDVSLELLPML